ncbi:MAG: M14 family metallopeptidase [Myxococcota bacterium]
MQYGQSVGGRPLLAIRVPSTRADAPRVMICANIHGVEFIGNRVATAALSQVIARGLNARAEVWALPCLNPDGYARTWETDGDRPLGFMRKNAHGVDLNRNFPMPWSSRPVTVPFAGARTPESATYRGAAPASEPEVAHLIALMGRIRPHASVNLHAFMGTVIQPKVRHRTDHQIYGRLIGAIQRAQPRWRYTRLAFPLFDVFTGEQEDYQHHVLRCWSVCLECFPIRASFRQHVQAPSVFWRFNPRSLKPWIENDVSAVFAYLNAALQEKRPPDRPGSADHLMTW